MVADLFSLLAQTASPKGEAGKGRIAQRASTERKAEKETKDSRGVGKGKAGNRLVRRLEQTSSVCLRRQLPRRGKPRKGVLRRALLQRGKPGKGELRRALLQRGKPRKKRKTAEALERAKRGKGWCGGWSRPLQSAYADSFPEGGSREKANCAERFYREEYRERNERQPWRWNGQSREDRNDSAACGHKNR